MTIRVPEDRPPQLTAKRVVESTTDSQQLAVTAQEAKRAEREGLTELEWAEVEERPPYLVLKADGSLWRREVGIPKDGRRPRDWRYAITNPDNGVPVVLWFRRSLAPAPETVTELDRREAEKRKAAERQQAEVEAVRKARAATARTVTAHDYDGTLPPTLRAVAERLHLMGGTIRIEAGRVVVALPPGEIGQGQLGPKLAAYLYAADGPIIEAVRGKAGPVAPGRLPDRAMLPSGKLAP